MNTNLIDYFEATVLQFPNKIAICDAVSQFSFLELKNKAQTISNQLISNYNSINKPVAVFLPKSNDAIISFLAILYSGNCYAPLDIKNPESRIKSIVKVLKPIVIITNSLYFRKLSKYNLGIDIIIIDNVEKSNVTYSIRNYKQCIDTDPAYVIHTSGSTGVPKGVAISHRSIFDYINWAIETFDITEKEIIGNQAPFIFDNSTLDIYLMMFAGATLNVIPDQLFMFPAKLLVYLETNNVNFVFWVPSVLVNIANLDLLDSIELPSLKKVLFAGEVMPTKHLNYWIKHLDDKVLFANLYGPTEITVDCTYYIVNRELSNDEVLPIGKPCRNSDVLILNENNQRCQLNEYGELCVRGTSLALGYWNNLEKTNSVFVQNPLNTSYPEKIYRTGDIAFKNERDEIIFVGRKDRQIKHLGYRIELGEIEHTVLSVFDAIKACVAYDDVNKEIILFYESEEEISIKEFRVRLGSALIKYMIPTKYFRIDHLPLTSNGKVDRVSLEKEVTK
ncbi:amino acid adenylation domain-containing protein [uncultured Winogradskyella sp.]|uniref:amino acid adenylation domain-containing protein n=1 Tax=uncultured Winogradskyella sp. TaxID=395353 RepID=UPI002630DE38|nr:amino acid adenylation domain-containing protein [uncultured Winogradskyella sp.]